MSKKRARRKAHADAGDRSAPPGASVAAASALGFLVSFAMWVSATPFKVMSGVGAVPWTSGLRRMVGGDAYARYAPSDFMFVADACVRLWIYFAVVGAVLWLVFFLARASASGAGRRILAAAVVGGTGLALLALTRAGVPKPAACIVALAAAVVMGGATYLWGRKVTVLQAAAVAWMIGFAAVYMAFNAPVILARTRSIEAAADRESHRIEEARARSAERAKGARRADPAATGPSGASRSP